MAKKSGVRIAEAKQLIVLAAIMAHALGAQELALFNLLVKTIALPIRSMNGSVTGDNRVRWMPGQIISPRNMKQSVSTIGNLSDLRSEHTLQFMILIENFIYIRSCIDYNWKYPHEQLNNSQARSCHSRSAPHRNPGTKVRQDPDS